MLYVINPYKPSGVVSLHFKVFTSVPYWPLTTLFKFLTFGHSDAALNTWVDSLCRNEKNVAMKGLKNINISSFVNQTITCKGFVRYLLFNKFEIQLRLYSPT